jgi:hypothetical protein
VSHKYHDAAEKQDDEYVYFLRFSEIMQALCFTSTAPAAENTKDQISSSTAVSAVEIGRKFVQVPFAQVHVRVAIPHIKSS